MATIVERIRSLFEVRRTTPIIPGPYVKGELQPVPDPAGVINPGDVFAASSTVLTQNTGESDRIARYDLFDSMDAGDVEAMLDAIVDAVITFEDEPGICFKLEGKSRSVQALNDMATYTELHQKLPQIIRDMVKYGDAFLELIGDQFIERVQTYDPHFIYVAMDERGNINPNRAYVQYNSSGEEVAVWSLAEMVQFKFRNTDRSAYSPRGLLDGIQADWQNLIKMEQGLVIARTTRAYPRNLHLLDTTNKSTADAKRSVAAYIKAVTRQEPTMQIDRSTFDTLTRTDLAVNEDYFVTTGYIQAPNGTLEPKRHDIKLLDPNIAGLGELADVEYARRKLFSRIPTDVIGIPSQYVDLTNQHVAYARLLKKIQQAVERGLRYMFLQQLLMLGISPDDLVIVWPVIQSGEQWRFQDSRYRKASTEQIQIESKLYSRKFILMHQYGHTEEEATQILQEILDEQQSLGDITAPQAISTGSSRASQAASGDQSGNSVDTPNPEDNPGQDQRRANQTANGAGGSNTQ